MTTINATVDFAKKARRNDMSGFLHGISTSNAPLNQVIAKLKPTFWRTVAGSTGLTSRLNTIDKDITPIVVLSDIYGYPNSTPAWNGNPAPYSDANATWISTVTTLANYHKGQNVIFDIWNEGDLSTSYDGTQAQFFATFKAAHDTIRSVYGPNAIIMGPSCSTYNATFNSDFLSYCTSNGLVVQAFGYHDFVDSDPSVIPSHISAIKTLAASNPSVVVEKYYITEHTRDTSWMNPGDCLNYLYYMAEAGIDGAVRACWNNLSSTNTCYDNSMTNLVDSATGSPHAAYYAYLWYSEIKRDQVKCTSGNSYLAVMASGFPSEVLVGFGNSGTATVDVALTLNNLGAIGVNYSSVRADIYMVSASGETIVNQPTSLGSSVLAVNNGVVSISLLGVNRHELYKIVLRQ